MYWVDWRVYSIERCACRMDWSISLRIFSGILLAFAMCSASNATSLKQAVRKAVETNPNIEAAILERRANEYRLGQAKGRLFPEIELSADIGSQRIDRPQGLGPNVNDRWRNRKQFTFTIRQALFDGFDRANDIYRSQARITASMFKTLARSEAVALNAIEAYVDIDRHQTLLSLANRNVERHQQLLKITKERIDGGKAPESDAVQTQERLEAAKALVSQITIALQTSKAKYKSAVGEAAKNIRKVPAATGIPTRLRSVIDTSLKNNPEVRERESIAEIADFDREQFKSNLYPKLFFEGSATRGDEIEGTPGRNDELKAAVVLRWRLFDGGVYLNRERELAEKASQRRLEQQVLARELVETIEVVWSRWTTGRNEMNALAAQVRQNARVVELYENEYEAGNRSLLDVLDAESAKFAGEFQFYNSRSLQLFSGYRLLANMGNLLEYFGIENPANERPLDVGVFSVGESNPFEKLKIPPLR